jgi:hypothetical protein
MSDLSPTSTPTPSVSVLERVLVSGDLAGLSESQRLEYYRAVCESLGINPLTRPFEYLRLNGRLVLYATRAAADQLRALHGISIIDARVEQRDDLLIVTVRGRTRDGREDVELGAVSVAGQRGDALANAQMKALTKAKRRLTLSLAGLGWMDESETETIPGAQRVSEPAPALTDEVHALRQQLAERAKELPEDSSLRAQAREAWRSGDVDTMREVLSMIAESKEEKER